MLWRSWTCCVFPVTLLNFKWLAVRSLQVAEWVALACSPITYAYYADLQTSTQSSIITSTTRFSDSTTSVLSSIPSSSKFSATQPTSPTIESATSSSYIPPTDSPLPNPKSSLSSGAKAGVGVGITLGVLLVLGTAAFFFWFGKRIASRKTNQRQDSIDNGSVPSEVEGKPVPVCPQELEGLSLPAELPEKRFKRWTRLDNQYQDIDEAEVDDR